MNYSLFPKPVPPTSEMAKMSLQEHSLVYKTRTIIDITQKRANASQLVALLLCHSGSACPRHVAIIEVGGLRLTWRSQGNPSTKLAKATSAGRCQSLLPAWRLTSKLGISLLWMRPLSIKSDTFKSGVPRYSPIQQRVEVTLPG